MSRAFNFSAGPATLPESVLRQAQDEMLEWRTSGASIVEHSHRGPEFIQVAAEAEADLRTLMSIPDDYAVLFLGGGATTGQPNFCANSAVSTFMPLSAATSVMFTASSSGTCISASWVVR